MKLVEKAVYGPKEYNEGKGCPQEQQAFKRSAE
jgi:hypothetical protein